MLWSAASQGSFINESSAVDFPGNFRMQMNQPLIVIIMDRASVSLVCVCVFVYCLSLSNSLVSFQAMTQGRWPAVSQHWVISLENTLASLCCCEYLVINSGIMVDKLPQYENRQTQFCIFFLWSQPGICKKKKSLNSL